MMMKLLILLINITAYQTQAYDEKYDRIEIENIVKNDVIHQTVNECILGELDCGSYWKEVRELAPEIAQDRCAHCTARQKTVVRTYIEATKRKYPETWQKIHDMFKKNR